MYEYGTLKPVEATFKGEWGRKEIMERMSQIQV
jgi:hypothetical protein